MYDVVDSNGKIILAGFSSRSEAKLSRGEDQFVIRGSSHPMGRSKFSAMKSKIKYIQTEDDSGNLTKKRVRTQ